MDVSVVIPAYNCEKTISLLLESLKIQETDLTYEVIVVDNSSSDNTRAILNFFSLNYPVPLHICEQPRGVSISTVRNHGVKYATGLTLAFIDSDCVPDSDWIQIGQDLVNDYDDCALIAGGCRPPLDGTWVELAWHSIRAGHKQGSIFVHGANFFINRNLFNLVGGFREELETSEDYDLGRRVAKHHRVVSVPEFSVVHYGEANTLYKKVAKERWYSRNVIATLSTNPFYKPFWISLVFLIFQFILLSSIVFMSSKLFLVSCFGLIGLSIFLTNYFCTRANNFVCFIKLIPICFTYLLGRSLGIIDSFYCYLRNIVSK